MTPKIIFEEKIAKRIENNPELGGEINAVYQFHITGENGGTWNISCSQSKNQVQAGEIPNPQCIITISDQDLVSLVSGQINPQLAFMTGKLKVKGNLGLALKLGKILKD